MLLDYQGIFSMALSQAQPSKMTSLGDETYEVTNHEY
jgi:hypothetical protein